MKLETQCHNRQDILEFDILMRMKNSHRWKQESMVYIMTTILMEQR